MEKNLKFIGLVAVGFVVGSALAKQAARTRLGRDLLA